MRALRLGWLYFKVGAMNELQYRANLVVQVVQSLIALGMGLVVLALVYSHTQELNGWTQPELLAVLGIFTLMNGVIQMSIQPNMLRLAEEVQDGKLDYALTKPEDAQLLLSVRDVRIWQVVEVVFGAIIVLVALVRLGGGLGVLDAAGFVVALALGVLTIYCFWVVLTTSAFWIVRADNVIELFQGVYQTGRWPVGIYPDWLRLSITFLVPIAFAVTVPAEALTSRLEWTTLVFAAVFAAALFAFTRWFFRVGLRRYSGASA